MISGSSGAMPSLQLGGWGKQRLMGGWGLLAARLPASMEQRAGQAGHSRQQAQHRTVAVAERELGGRDVVAATSWAGSSQGEQHTTIG